MLVREAQHLSGLSNAPLCVAVQTNTRAMQPEAAHATVSEVCANLQKAAAGEPLSVVLR